MALDNFISTIHQAKLEQALRKLLVARGIANTEYDGQLRNLGDKVKIKQLSDITITSYTKGSTTVTPAAIDDAALELVADQSYYFAFKKYDTEANQSKSEILRNSTDNAAYGFADTADAYLLGLYASAGMTSYATGTTNWDVTSLNVEEVILTVAEELDDNKLPRAGRFWVIPPWFMTKLILAGIVARTDNTELYNNGYVQRALGFDFYLSHNVSIGTASTGANTRMIVGVKGKSLGFADAITNIEAYRVEADFADAVKGLYVFGGKIVRPDMTMTVYCDKTAEA